jgi:aryl-alcohol dehydrogenase (NADP+)
MLPLCADEKIGVIPWSPLARGRLTRDWDEATERSEADPIGKMLYGHVASDRVIVEAVASIAAARGVSRAQIALAWLLRNPVISAPIVGARKATHLDDALASLDVELTDDEVAELENGYTPHPVAQGGLSDSAIRPRRPRSTCCLPAANRPRNRPPNAPGSSGRGRAAARRHGSPGE